MTLFALRQWISETVNVAAGNPNIRVHKDRCVDADHVLAVPHHRLPPLVLDVAFEFYTDWPVVVEASDASVNLAALKNEPSPFG